MQDQNYNVQEAFLAWVAEDAQFPLEVRDSCLSENANLSHLSSWRDSQIRAEVNGTAHVQNVEHNRVCRIGAKVFSCGGLLPRVPNLA